MKITTSKNLVLSGLLGLSALGVVGASAVEAAPRDRDSRNDVREERRDVREAREDLQRERREAQRARGEGNRRREARDVEEAREDLRRERQELKRERREEGRGGRYQNRDAYRPGYTRPGYGRPSYSRPGYSRPSWSNGGQQYTGTVTRVRDDRSFDVRIGNAVYNVYTNSLLPRALDEGDVVRVSGLRQNNNDIRNASVSIISNR